MKIRNMNLALLSKFFILVLCYFNLSVLHAEEDSASDMMKESVVDVSTVAATTLGGAVLGLSTLSFVSEPKEHLKNIVVGGAIGLIVGVVYVAVQKATESHDMYMQAAHKVYKNSKTFSTAQRFSWAQVDFYKNSSINNAAHPMAYYTFSF